MTLLDKFIQRQRIHMAMRYIPLNEPDLNILDIGCHQGELFRALGKKLHYGYGIDPLLQQENAGENFLLMKGYFPEDWKIPVSVNCICLLAVLEHIPPLTQDEIAAECFRLLIPDGLVIITVPSQKTDILLGILKKLRLIKGMSLEDHYGFDPGKIPSVFGQAGFTLRLHKNFQIGFNNIFVLQKQQQPSR